MRHACPLQSNPTALALAAAKGKTETMRVLLDRGADLEAKDKVGHGAGECQELMPEPELASKASGGSQACCLPHSGCGSRP
tara:strand:+ start:282 stop:524 length:243 start_codon:yes stop_codon:yes gene_type:complete